MSIGERLQQLREEIDFSQRKMSIALKIDASMYGKYERNDRFPTTEILIRIADYFNISVDYLLGRTEIRYYNKILNSQNDLPLEAIKELESYTNFLIQKYKKE